MTAVSSVLHVRDVENELSRQLDASKEVGHEPVQRAHMSNLVIYCDDPNNDASFADVIPAVVELHPARVLLLVGQSASEKSEIGAEVSVWCRRHRGGPKACSEQITLRAEGDAVARLPFAVRGLLIGDLPTNLLWRCNSPPPLAGPLLGELAENAEQVVYDSIGWPDPARCVMATAEWQSRFERSRDGKWRVASDLNWRRLKYWRRITAQALDPMTAPGALESIMEVVIEHGPHAVVQGLLLGSWLASRLGWRVSSGHMAGGVTMDWKLATRSGSVKMVLHRLSTGPAEVRRMRIACKLNGNSSALVFTVPEKDRLAVVPEHGDAAHRTLTAPAPPLAELIARQLSDRERDSVFQQSMAISFELARSLLG
jgi:glucose-6-phosphate dehydrogenase assembly protein OpcA